MTLTVRSGREYADVPPILLSLNPEDALSVARLLERQALATSATSDSGPPP